MEGINIYSPVVHWHETASKYGLPKDAQWWRKINFDALNRCDGMYLLTIPGWEESDGVTMERRWAEGKPHFHIHIMSPVNLESFKHFEKELMV